MLRHGFPDEGRMCAKTPNALPKQYAGMASSARSERPCGFQMTT
jgi:hypothetical protein